MSHQSLQKPNDLSCPPHLLYQLFLSTVVLCMFEDSEVKHLNKVDVEIRTPTFLSCERAIYEQLNFCSEIYYGIGFRSTIGAKTISMHLPAGA